MARQRTKWNKATKFRIAMEAYKGDRSITDIAEEYGVNPTQIHRWKKELMEHGPEIFAGKHDEERQVVEAERDELYRKVGHQQVQIDFLKKRTGCRSVAELRQMIEPDHRRLSVRQQCDLLGLNRATLYYRPQREREEVPTLMRRIDELHTAHITWGSRKMRDATPLDPMTSAVHSVNCWTKPLTASSGELGEEVQSVELVGRRDANAVPGTRGESGRRGLHAPRRTRPDLGPRRSDEHVLRAVH